MNEKLESRFDTRQDRVRIAQSQPPACNTGRGVRGVAMPGEIQLDLLRNVFNLGISEWI
jgi:hypothetical protein